MEATLQQSNDGRQAFQRLKTQLHRRMIDAIDLSKAGQLDENDLRAQLRALATHLCTLEAVALSPENRDDMVREIMDEIYGFGPLEPLMNDPEVSDVLVNGANRVFGCGTPGHPGGNGHRICR